MRPISIDWRISVKPFDPVRLPRSTHKSYGVGGFMQISLSLEEKELLMDVLEERHRELLREISGTSHKHFKIGLEENEILFESIMNKLHAPALEHVACIPT
jgi:hypothetical protein